MVTAGQELDLNQPVTVGPADLRIIQFGKLGILAGRTGACDIRFILLFIAPEHILQTALRQLWFPAHKSPIKLMHIRFAEHRVQALESLGSLSEDGDSTDRTVETMRKPHEHLAGLVISLGDEGLVFLAQRFVAGLVTLDDLPHPLVDDKKMVVFI